jgi:hypothetical protein
MDSIRCGCGYSSSLVGQWKWKGSIMDAEVLGLSGDVSFQGDKRRGETNEFVFSATT